MIFGLGFNWLTIDLLSHGFTVSAGMPQTDVEATTLVDLAMLVAISNQRTRHR